jgi:PhnB protein
MEISPYLGFNGQCEAAFKFYERVFGGKIVGIMTYGASPMAQQMPAEMHDKIIHVRLLVGDQALMGGDASPQNYEAAQGFNVSITVKDPEEADRVFNELSKDGKVTMPMQKTFWSARFGMTVDRFGTPWLINCAQAA